MFVSLPDKFTKKRSYSVESVALIVAGIIAITKLVIWLSYTNKGFEMTDEGCYLIAVNTNIIYADLHMFFGFLIQGLFPFVDFTPQTSRVFAIAFEVLGVLLLSIGLHRYQKKYDAGYAGKNNWLLYTFIGITVLFSGNGSRGLCYLHLTPFFIFGSVGLMFLFLASNKTTRYIYPLIIGLFLAMLLHVKFSSALIGAGIVLLTVLLFSRLKQSGYFVILSIVGFCAWHGYLFRTIVPADELWALYQEGWKVIRLLGYGIVEIVLYTHVMLDLPSFFYYFIFESVSVTLLYFVCKKLSKPLLWFSWLFFPVIIFTLLSVHHFLPIMDYDLLADFMFRFIDGYVFLTLFALVFLFYFVRSHNNTNKASFIKQYWVYMVLFIMPFTCVIGTDVALMMSLVTYIAPWAILVFIALIKLYRQHPHLKLALFSSLFLLWVLSFAHFLETNFYFDDPSTHDRPQALSKQQLLLPHLNIKVDEPTFTFLTSTEKALKNNGYKAGMPLIALTDMPGLIYYLNAYSPEQPWYFGPESTTWPHNAADVNCYHIKNIELRELEQPPFFVIREDVQPEIYNCLIESNLNFPENYQAVDSIFSPYTNQLVFIYSPK